MMSKDFTLDALELLYSGYIRNGFKPVTFENFILQPTADKTIILRHDVDKKPFNSLRVAQIQNRMGIKGTFYFRIVPESFAVKIIESIASLGHEIGYHYEDLTLCNGNLEKAAEHFEVTLEKFRKYYPVKTICMHGSPMTKWDNKDLWKKINYKSFGIIGEPYFDIDFTNGLYLTDTGRTWNGDAYSIRDRVVNNNSMRFETTFEIVNALDENKMPDFIMQNFHPQRWTNGKAEWMQELVLQRIKNTAKAMLLKLRKKISD